MSDQAKGRLYQVLGLIIAAAGLLTANGWIMRAVLKDIVREELRSYESKSESQMRWDGNRAERTEIIRRYDSELADIRRRLSSLEADRARGRLQ